MKGLALDGGGCFGVAQAALLSKLDAGELQRFEFLAGTSIGSVVAAAVASGMSSKNLLQFFDDWAPKIFRGHRWRSKKLLTPRYPDAELNQALQTLFPGRFGDLAVPVFITTADLDRQRLKVFCSVDIDDGELWLWEVLRMAVAAESYFSPWRGFGDGGIFANNPSMVAVAGILSHSETQLSDIELCSIGTGEKCVNVNVGTTTGWSFFRWGKYLLQAQLSGASDKMHEYFVSRLPLKSYLRIQFKRASDWEMDDSSLIPECLSKWDQVITAAVPRIKAFLQ